MKASEILTQAAGFVAQGHCKDKLQDQHDRVCAVGALNKAATGNAFWFLDTADDLEYQEWERARTAMDKVIREQYPDRVLRVYNVLVPFNNDPATTAAEVVAVMEKAAANLQEQGQ